MKYLMGIDIGTSGTKTALFDTSGNVIVSATSEYPLYQPQNGWAEQNPEDWWRAAALTINTVIRKSGVKGTDIAGVGLTGQMHGLVMLDENGNVLRNAIIWCDGRSTAECGEITERVGSERLFSITASPALASFTASKILWVRNNEPEVFKKCAHILLPKDYIRYRLTGEFATDVSDASGMQLLDIKNRCWSDEVLNKLDIDKALLAKLYESPEISARVSESATRLTGLSEGTIVAAGAGDNAAAAVGTGVVCDRTAFTTIGTSGVVFAHTSQMKVDARGRVHTFCCAVPGKWHVMGVTQAAGFSLKWFRDNFCESEKAVSESLGVDSYKIMDSEAEKSPIGSGGIFYLPYLMGERTPHLDPDCRGAFLGLSAMHKKRDMLRACMEGVSYSLRDCVEVLKEMGIDISDMRVCGGGGKSGFWRRMLADVFGCPVKTLKSDEGPALGAAILAGVAAGVYPSVEEGCAQAVKESEILMPDGDNAKIYEKNYQKFRALYNRIKNI